MVTPMSDVSLDPNKVLSFSIFNRVDKEVTLTVKHFCDIDRKEFKETQCEKYFRVNYSDGFRNNQLVIKAQQTISVKVQLKDFSVAYALFKPKYEPLEEEKQKKGIKFVFGYQPGFLYLVKPDNTSKLTKPKVSTVINEKYKVIKFQFDVSAFNSPQILNLSARITDKKTAKTIKLVKLASNKIIDPTRKTLDLQGIFADADFAKDICYDIYIKPVSKDSVLYKLNGCDVAMVSQKLPDSTDKSAKKSKSPKKKKANK